MEGGSAAAKKDGKSEGDGLEPSTMGRDDLTTMAWHAVERDERIPKRMPRLIRGLSESAVGEKEDEQERRVMDKPRDLDRAAADVVEASPDEEASGDDATRDEGLTRGRAGRGQEGERDRHGQDKPAHDLTRAPDQR